MKVLVTGGAGYIGSVCVEELVRAGHDVTVIDDLVEGFREAVVPEATLHVGCLSQRAWVMEKLETLQPEAVIHFAALAKVGESMEKPGKYFSNNVSAGLNLLDACVASKVRKLVFSSTCATYGIPQYVPLDESHPQNPINPYGESKRMFEGILKWYEEIHGLAYVAFRYFNAAGAAENRGQSHREMSHLIPNILQVALGQKEACHILGTDYPTPDGTGIRDYIHILDLADAHIKAIASEATGCFNLGTGRGHSVREVIQTCERVTGKTIPCVEKARREGDPPELVAAPAKARETFGWKARFTDLEDIVASAWKWHQSHPQGYPSAAGSPGSSGSV
ncbi:UDP-glucose 4-epimerase GalE [Verrucomicrobia bacterium]|jgi:UDP-glucose 4-epimerase|nr:UDP-glucose 4-epimerase GalE [Verrucomicrobiota bacterium]